MSREGGSAAHGDECSTYLRGEELESAIASALEWIDGPVTVVDLCEIFSKRQPPSVLTHRVRRMSADPSGPLALVHRVESEGRWESWYFLRGREWDREAASFRP